MTVDGKTQVWTVGQKAVIGRETLVTVDRVTPSGRAVVGDRMFELNGSERKSTGFSRARLYHLTPEVEAEMAVIRRGRLVAADGRNVIHNAENWFRSTFNSFRETVPDLADVEKAERLVAAIRHVMEAQSVES